MTTRRLRRTSEPTQYEQHWEQALNALLMRHEAAQLAGRIADAISSLERAGALVDMAHEPVLWAELHEPLAEYFLDHAMIDQASPLIDEIVDVQEGQGEHDPALPKSLLLWCRLLDLRAIH